MKGEQRQVPPADIRLGELVLVRSGERIPIDGVVLRGDGTVDDACLPATTCRCRWIRIRVCWQAAGITGSLMLLRVTRGFEDCADRQIRRVQEEGTNTRQRSKKCVTVMAGAFIPVMVVLAVLLSVTPAAVHSGTSYHRLGLSCADLLVVCCPTALLISVPLASCAATADFREGRPRQGQRSDRKARRPALAVFDKTGTLTDGNLRSRRFRRRRTSIRKELSGACRSGGAAFAHPVARAVVGAYEGKAAEDRANSRNSRVAACALASAIAICWSATAADGLARCQGCAGYPRHGRLCRL